MAGLIDQLTELLKSEEEKRKEKEALAASDAISNADILKMLTPAPVEVVAAPPKPKPAPEPKPEPTAPAPAPAAIDPAAARGGLYDPNALTAYLERMRASGTTPSFTNIKGAPGFFINDRKQESTVPEADAILKEIKDPYSYTDPIELNRAKEELSIKLREALLTTQNRIEEEEGVSRIESQLANYLRAGFGGTQAVEGLKSALMAAKVKAASRLTIDKEGKPIGLEAKTFRNLQDVIDKFDLRAKELAEQKQDQNNMDRVLIAKGLQPKVVDTIRQIDPTYDNPAAVASMPPDVIALGKRIADNRVPDAVEVLGSMPEATDLYLKYISKNRSAEDVATSAAILPKWRDRLEKAGVEAAARLNLEADSEEAKGLARQLRNAKAAGDTKAALAILHSQETQSRLQELDKLKTRFSSDWLTADKLDSSNLAGLDEHQRAVANEVVNVVKEIGLPTSYADKINLIFKLESAGIPVDEATGLLRRMLAMARNDFDDKYKNTLGITMGINEPKLSVWGM